MARVRETGVSSLGKSRLLLLLLLLILVSGAPEVIRIRIRFHGNQVVFRYYAHRFAILAVVAER